jgi:hypothetical protein
MKTKQVEASVPGPALPLVVKEIVQSFSRMIGIACPRGMSALLRSGIHRPNGRT